MDKGPIEMGESSSFPKPAPRSSLDEDEVGVAYHQTLKGHTKEDQANMMRMGKIQELRVWYPIESIAHATNRGLTMAFAVEKLSSVVGFGLHGDHSGDMGGAHDVRTPDGRISYRLSIVGFTAAAYFDDRATYEGLVDGGPAGLIWSYIWTFCGFSFVVAVSLSLTQCPIK